MSTATIIVNNDKLLFTPGPLTTSLTVKEAMLHDLGSRDVAFIDIVRKIRTKLLGMGQVSQEQGYETIIMQGSGTFGVEAVLTSTVPANGHILVLINGAYGERMTKMLEYANIKYDTLRYAENESPRAEDVEKFLTDNPSVTHVVTVHCETTTGIFNPIKAIGEVVKRFNKTYIVDAMSSFGAVPVDIKACNIDFLVSSSNKCIEGVPGFSFTIASKRALDECKGRARSLSFDLYAQWEGLEKSGQFRFTPPTHVLLAFYQAILEHELEGGVEGRAERYKANYNTLMAGMRQLGFKEYLEPEKQGYIISSFIYPEDKNFDFQQFYMLLNERDLVIYPGKLSQVDCFRIGNIGHMGKKEIEKLLAAIEEVLKEMNVSL